MDSFWALLLTGQALIGLMILRNHIVYSIRMKILFTDFVLYSKLPSYDAMLFDVTKWTVKQFTKGLK